RVPQTVLQCAEAARRRAQEDARSLSLETIPPDLGIGEAGALAPVRMPGWLRRLGDARLTLAGAGVAPFLAPYFGVIGRPLALSAARFISPLAILCAVATLVARMGHRDVAGRATLLTQAIAASPNAHLIVDGDGAITYANSAFRRFFPDIKSMPLDAIALSL